MGVETRGCNIGCSLVMRRTEAERRRLTRHSSRRRRWWSFPLIDLSLAASGQYIFLVVTPEVC